MYFYNQLKTTYRYIQNLVILERVSNHVLSQKCIYTFIELLFRKFLNCFIEPKMFKYLFKAIDIKLAFLLAVVTQFYFYLLVIIVQLSVLSIYLYWHQYSIGIPKYCGFQFCTLFVFLLKFLPFKVLKIFLYKKIGLLTVCIKRKYVNLIIIQFTFLTL